jgi:lycopene beta-cyclase
MDAEIRQTDGFRFLYVLPFSPSRLLIEDTYYSDGPDLDRDRIGRELDGWVASRGWRAARIVREEAGTLPIPWRRGAGPRWCAPFVIGYAGGWFHPTTGYSLPQAARLAVALAGAPLADWPAVAAGLAAAHGKQASFCRLLNRLLFRAFEPEDRWRVLARFYRELPDDAVARFYALAMTSRDRARILCGWPPQGFSLRRLLAGAQGAKDAGTGER